MNIECVVCSKKFFTNYKNSVVCSEKCRKKYYDMYRFTLNKVKYNTRNSKKKYTNSKEKLLAIKEKYKNGVSKEIIENWLDPKINK